MVRLSFTAHSLGTIYKVADNGTMPVCTEHRRNAIGRALTSDYTHAKIIRQFLGPPGYTMPVSMLNSYAPPK